MSSNPPDQSCLAQSILKFLDERFKEAQRLYYKVLVIGYCIMAIGFCFGAVAYSWPDPPAWLLALRVFGSGTICWGVVISSTCPPGSVDLDCLLDKARKSRFCLGLACAGYSLFHAIRVPPHMMALAVPFAIVGSTQKLCEMCQVRATSTLAHMLAFMIFGLMAQNMNLSSRDHDHIVFAAVWLAGFLVLEIGWWRGRWLWTTRGGRSGFTPTIAAFYALYIFVGFCGLSLLVRGILDGLDGGRFDHILSDVLAGLAPIFPPCICVTLGRQRLFGFFARHFDRSARRAMRDAAFLAYLLETVPIQVGDAWWELRNNASGSPAGGVQDGQHQWQQGRITEIESGSFTVEFIAEGSSGVNKRRVPRAESNTSCQELLQKAQHSLRCIEWEHLTLELLSCKSSSGAVSVSQTQRFFQLSRPICDGEIIDFFLSHSWHDDPLEKYAALESIVSSFTRTHRRSPTFWIDIACIDQGSIREGLRVLPVNLMACKRTLVLCGPTFQQRLWCLLELFILTAFFEENVVHERLHFHIIGNEESRAKTLKQLANFDLRSAKCFDPNEEARLRRVMSSIGEKRLRQCVKTVAEHLVRKSCRKNIVLVSM